MPRERKRLQRTDTSDFLPTPMHRLVDRHRAILEKIRTRENAEYWGHMLIGEYYPDIPGSRAASGKLAALVGLTDYMDFYCARDYYSLLKEGKTLEEARRTSRSRGTEDLKSSRAFLPPRRPRDAKFGRGRPQSGGREQCGTLDPERTEDLHPRAAPPPNRSPAG